MTQHRTLREVIKRANIQRPWLVAVLLLLVMVLFAVIIYVRIAEKNQQNTIQQEAKEISLIRQLASSDPERLANVLNSCMVQIPAGDFIMGSDRGREDEHPQHMVYLDAFEIDRYETTNAQYQQFVQATGHRTPLYWINNRFPDGQPAYPVVGVGWNDANAYCEWAGKRLPTEAEWEKACRGIDARTYPWGNNWDPQRANVTIPLQAVQLVGHNELETSVWEKAWQLLQVTPANSEQPGLQPIGSYLEGASPYGILDMAGNVSEWVADWYNWSDYSKMPTLNPLGLAPRWNHSVRGSAWHDPVGDASWVQEMSRCSARSSSHSAQGDPRQGFRCARTIIP